MLSDEQVEKVRNEILRYIDENFPEEKRMLAKNQVLAMSPEELEEFIKEEVVVNGENQQTRCIFCSIVSGKASSYKIAENNTAIVVLELNPISKGHSLIIPKEHVSKDNMPAGAKELAGEIAERLKKLNPKKIDIFPQNLFGHEILNVLPIYTDENPGSERTRADPQELQKLREILKEKIVKIEAKIEPKIEEPKKEEKYRLPKRIP